MKKVEAVIRASKWDEVKQALKAIGIEEITVTSVLDLGSAVPRSILYRGVQCTLGQQPKVKLETVVDSNKVDDVVEAIYDNAHTGHAGDGRIMVIDLISATCVRTGEVVAATVGCEY